MYIKEHGIQQHVPHDGSCQNQRVPEICAPSYRNFKKIKVFTTMFFYIFFYTIIIFLKCGFHILFLFITVLINQQKLWKLT